MAFRLKMSSNELSITGIPVDLSAVATCLRGAGGWRRGWVGVRMRMRTRMRWEFDGLLKRRADRSSLSLHPLAV
jgi:hypothetical protein